MRHGLALVRGERGEVAARVERLQRWLAPLGCTWTSLWSADVLLVRWGAGGVAPAAARGEELTTRSVASWGEALPPALTDTGALLAAGDRELRALDGSHALFALGEGGRARVVSGAGGPSGLFGAAGADERGGCEAWATSAGAAALLGLGALRLDVDALPALLAFGSLFGEATHVRGVRAVGPGVRIDLAPGEPVRRGEYWPRAERWAPLPEAGADAAARTALLETLGRRLPLERAPWLALTAGRDSPVLAAAIALLGLGTPTFTFGEPDWPDVAGARAIAERMGLAHHHHALGALPEADVPAEADRDARWFDGLAGVGPTGPPALPAAMSAMVTGAGAEVGRAYAYQAVARSRPRPRTEHLVQALDPPGRLPGAPPEAVAAATAALRAWLEEPGLPDGWRKLDALYVEQRVGRWGTARISRTHPGPVLAPFSSPPLARALSALPLDDRLAVGFHRRLVAEVAPDVALPPMQVQRRGVPAPVRRLASAARAGHGPRATVAALAGRPAPAPFSPWPWAYVWHARPALRTWVADDLLADPCLTGWLGAPWAGALRTGFQQDDARHAERALLVAGLVLWARAAADLR